MPIITDLSSPQTAEGFILDPNGSSPLNLGNGGSLQLSELTIPPAQKRPEWASNGDVDGAALVRNPYHDNRDCSFKVRCMDGTMDQAVAAIKLLEDKLQEACIQGANNGPGLAFLWTPAHASTGLTGYMLFAQITDLPVTYSDGWFAQHPVLTVVFQAKPFLYGAEVTGPTATGTTPVLTVAVPSVPGDVPAEARLVVTDGSTQARRWVEWGLEQRYYNAGTPSSLLIDSEDLVTSGFAGTLATRTGGYRRAGATHDTVSATLLTQPIAICGTGTLPHVGMFRIKARIWATSTAEYWRLTWQDGDAPFSSNDWVQPVAAGFNELDLGIVTIDQAAAGSQKWTSRIEAYTTTSGGEVGEVDYLILFPRAEGYGRLEANFSYAPGMLTAFDDFESGTTGAALSARTAVLGGTWATSGATTDFLFEAPGSGGPTQHLNRNTTSDASYRYAILGTATPSDVEVGTDARVGVPTAGNTDQAVIARWTDASNHVRLRLRTNSTSGAFLVAEQVVTGTVTTLASVEVSVSNQTWYKLRVVIYSTGHLIGWLLTQNGGTLATVETLTSVLATGGALATGKSGIGDMNAPITVQRRYDNFYAATPAAESLTINSGRTLEIRSDSNLRQSSDGATYGDIASRGSRLFIPQAGGAGRTSRIAVRATREDIVTSASRNDGDSITLATFFTPRYLAVPR